MKRNSLASRSTTIEEKAGIALIRIRSVTRNIIWYMRRAKSIKSPAARSRLLSICLHLIGDKHRLYLGAFSSIFEETSRGGSNASASQRRSFIFSSLTLVCGEKQQRVNDKHDRASRARDDVGGRRAENSDEISGHSLLDDYVACLSGDICCSMPSYSVERARHCLMGEKTCSIFSVNIPFLFLSIDAYYRGGRRNHAVWRYVIG